MSQYEVEMVKTIRTTLEITAESPEFAQEIAEDEYFAQCEADEIEEWYVAGVREIDGDDSID